VPTPFPTTAACTCVVTVNIEVIIVTHEHFVVNFIFHHVFLSALKRRSGVSAKTKNNTSSLKVCGSERLKATK
jgi:hypothetical protein